MLSAADTPTPFSPILTLFRYRILVRVLNKVRERRRLKYLT